MNSNNKSRYSENPSTQGNFDALWTQTEQNKLESKFETDLLNGLHANIRNVLEANKTTNVSDVSGCRDFLQRQFTKRELKATLECGQENPGTQESRKYFFKIRKPKPNLALTWSMRSHRSFFTFPSGA